MGYIDIDGATDAQTGQTVWPVGTRCFVYQNDADTLVRLFADGDLTDLLANPIYVDQAGAFASSYAISGTYRIVIEAPNGQTLISIADIDTGSDVNEATVLLAEEWAAADRDVVVANGRFSALHYAEVAGEAETAAVAARTQAELAAVAAGAEIYASVGAGLAGTSDGDVFLVSTAPGIQVYENDTGSDTFLGWFGEVLYDDVAAVLASTEAGFAIGTNLRTREGGHGYKVAASGASDHHLTTVGGVKLYVTPSASGSVDIRAFGATGNSVDDQDAAAQAAQNSGLPIFIPAGFVLRYSTPLVLSAAWLGGGKGQGTPGSAIDNSTASETAEMRFTGTGWAVTTSAPFQHLCLRADTSVAGQNGIKFLGALIGQIGGPVRVLEFDETGIEVGGFEEERGIFFASFSGLEVNNAARMGQIGVMVQCDGISSSNANMFYGTFVNGAWENYLTIQGHNNTFLNTDVNPKPTLVAGLGGTITEGVLIDGDGNTLINPYFEPEPNAFSGTLIRFSANASSNKIDRLYTPSAGSRMFSLVEDLGIANEVTLVTIGENFTPSIGVSYSEENLIPNPGFISTAPTDLPYGWVTGGGSTGSFEVDDTVARGGFRSLRVSTNDNRYQAICYLNSASSETVRNAMKYVPIKRLEDQTVSVGVWCLSNTPGLGAVKVTAGAGTLGVASHSGSGEWEFLTVRTRVAIGATEISIALRNASNFSNTTGDCWFSEPTFVLGNDVSRYAGTSKLDAEEALLVGRVVHNPMIPFGDGDTTPSILAGNWFTTANSTATTITDFEDVPVGGGAQEIHIFVGDGNTTLANNGNIRTTTNTAKALSPNSVSKLVWTGSRWIEF